MSNRIAAPLQAPSGDPPVPEALAQPVLIADPSPPGDLGEASSAAQAADIEALIASMSDLSERELMDQVYRKMTFILCNACYVEWIENPAEEGHAGN